MAGKVFTAYDVIVNVISLVTYLLDLGTDILVVVHFLSTGHPTWGYLSLGFILAPTVAMQAYSLKWHLDDGTLTWLQVIPHLLLISPIVRYMNVIRVGLRSIANGGTRDLEKAFSEQNDVSILRLVEAFLESAPQLCLLLYVLLSTSSIQWLSALSAASSMLSLGWAVCAYSDASRLAHRAEYQRRWLGMAAHALWQITMVASRITAIVLFAHVLGGWIFLFVGIHWGLMTLWMMTLGSDFGEGLCARTTFRFVAGFIYTFSFLNLNDGRTRVRMLIFYCIMLVENATLSGVWLAQKPASVSVAVTVAAACVVYGGFFLGTLFMLLYYRCFHPSGPIFLCPNDPKHNRPAVPRCFDLAVGTRSSVALSTSDQLTVLGNAMVEVSSERTLVSMVTKSGTCDHRSRAKSPQRRTRRDLNQSWRKGMKVSPSSSESSMDTTATEGQGDRRLESRDPETGSRLNLQNKTKERWWEGDELDDVNAVSNGGFASGPPPKHMSTYGRSSPPPPLPPRLPDEVMEPLPADQTSQVSSMCSIRTDMRPGSLSPLSASQIWGESQARLQAGDHEGSGSDRRGDLPSSPSSPEYVSMAMPKAASFYVGPQEMSTRNVTAVRMTSGDTSQNLASNSTSQNWGSRSTLQNESYRSTSQNVGHSSSQDFDQARNNRYKSFSVEEPHYSYLASVHLSPHAGHEQTPDKPPRSLPREERIPASAGNSHAQQSFSSSGSEKHSSNTSSSMGQSADSRSPPRMAGGEGMCSGVQSPYIATSSDISGTEKSSSSGNNNPDQSFSPRSLMASQDNPREARCSWPGFSDTSGLEDMRDSTLPHILESSAEGFGAGDETIGGDPQLSSSFSQSHFMKSRRNGFDAKSMAGVFSPASMISHNDAEINSDSSLMLSQLHSRDACSDDFSLTQDSASEDAFQQGMANNPSADSPPLELNPPIEPEFSPFARSRRIPSLRIPRDSSDPGISQARGQRDARDDFREQPQLRSQEAGSQTTRTSVSNLEWRRPPTSENPVVPAQGNAPRPYNAGSRMNGPPHEDVSGIRGQHPMPPCCVVVREEKQSITAGRQLTHMVSSRSVCSHHGEVSVTSSSSVSASTSEGGRYSIMATFGSSSSNRDDSILVGSSDTTSPPSYQPTPTSHQQRRPLARNEACQTSRADIHQENRGCSLAGGSHSQSSHEQGEGHSCRSCGCQGGCSGVPHWNTPGHLDYLDLTPTPGVHFVPSMHPMGPYPPMLYIPVPLHQFLPPSGLSNQQLHEMLYGQGNQWRPQDHPAYYGPPLRDQCHEPLAYYGGSPRRMFRDRVRSLSSPDMHSSPMQEDNHDRGSRASGDGHRRRTAESSHPDPTTPRSMRRSGEPRRRSTPREYEEGAERYNTSQSHPNRSRSSRKGRQSLGQEQLAMLEMDRDSSQPDGTEDRSECSDPQLDRESRQYPRVQGRRERRGSKMDILHARHFEDNLDNTVIDMREHRGGRSRKEADPGNTSAQSGREPKPERVEGRRGMGLAEISRNSKKHDNSLDALFPDDPDNLSSSRRVSGKSTPVDHNLSQNSTSSGPRQGRLDENRHNRPSSSSKDKRKGNTEGSTGDETRTSSSQRPADDSGRQPFSSLENINKASGSQKTPGNGGPERTVVGSSGCKSLKRVTRPKVSSNK